MMYWKIAVIGVMVKSFFESLNDPIWLIVVWLCVMSLELSYKGAE